MAVTNYYTVNGALIGEKTAGGTRVDYLTDALGSVTATVNQSAQVVNTYRYKPYGAQLAKTGVGADPAFGWVGTQGYRPTQKKFSDFYVRARHNDTVNGRWTSTDPIGLNLGEINLFQYSNSNPITFTDPSGLVPCSPGEPATKCCCCVGNIRPLCAPGNSGPATKTTLTGGEYWVVVLGFILDL